MQRFAQYLVSFVLILFAVHLFGQSQRNFVPLNLGRIEGDINFRNVIQDNLGFVYLNGKSDLYKYDGYDFTLIPYTNIFGEDFKSERSVNFFKDTNGDIWLSSFNGELIRFNQPGNYESLINDSINQGSLVQFRSFLSTESSNWMGGNQGQIYKYNKNNSSIINITSVPSSENSQIGISSIVGISEFELLIGCTNGYIYNYKIEQNIFTKIPGLPASYSGTILFEKDNNKKIWIFTQGSDIYSYTHKEKQIVKESFGNQIKTDHFFYKTFLDKNGMIWAGTDGAGLLKLNPKNKTTETYLHNPLNKFSLSNNTVLDIAEDSHKNIWVATKGNNIQILPNSSNKIEYYSGTPDNSPTRVLSIFKDSDNQIWCGTDGKGLSRITESGKIKYFPPTTTESNSFKGAYIQTIAEDKYKNIWVGTYQNGLWIYNKSNNQFQKLAIKNNLGAEITDVRFIYQDKLERMWVTTYSGIFIFKNKQLIASFYGHGNGLYGNESQAIAEDKSGDLWIGINNGGLFQFQENQDDLSKSFFKQYLYHDRIEGDNHNYNIGSMEVDAYNNLWIVTVTGALIQFNTDNKKYVSHKEKEEFKDINFKSVELGTNDNLWLSSNKGIVHFNVSDSIINTYYQTDGLQGDYFLRRSSFKDEYGTLYFGGINGMNYFIPENIEPKVSDAELFITDIEILNQPAQSIIPKQIINGILNVEELNLKYNQSSFSFRFSAIDNLLNSNFHYAYRLRGFQEDWVIPNKEPIATYTNIKNGDYEFEVKAGSKKGIWDIESKAIKLTVLPPWWLSGWAYFFYAFILGLISYYGYQWLRLSSKLKREEWLYKKEKEMYALKLNFFTKMSHEIQTPLTLILGPTREMLSTERYKDPHLTKKLKIIQNNAKRLSRIATELTSIRNLELGKLAIKVSKRNIIDDLKNICSSFEELAEFKGIDFQLSFDYPDIYLWYDLDKIEHVVYNLVYNALKFTPRGGKVVVKVDLAIEKRNIVISIHDSGPGIPKYELEKIFMLFYQSELGKKVKGSGIGLALAKELIELHHGEIKVTSSKESGTCFSFYLPLDKNKFNVAEFNENRDIQPIGLVENLPILGVPNKVTDDDVLTGAEIADIQHSTIQRTILIVEDNYNMQIFLDSVFSKSYNLIFAENGEQGVEMAIANKPDLIISDVMMPKLNGIEMSKILHAKKYTHHIPIILMSAHNQENTKINSLKSGAIEYIKKPFDIQELKVKVENIIVRSENLLNKYKTDSIANPDVSEIDSADILFMQNLMKQIQLNIDNSNFKLEDLAHTMNMSYSSIYRKCHSNTGKTLVNFMRWIRIKNATLLILKHGNGISESAYQSGFNSPKYFTKCFKNEFGMSPNQFRKEAQNHGIEKTLEKYKIEFEV